MLEKRSTHQSNDISDRTRQHNDRDSARTLGIITERGGNESHHITTVSTRPATVELLCERTKETFRKTTEANVIQLLARRNSYGIGNVLEPAGCRRDVTSRRCDDLDDLARQAPALLLASFVLSRDRVPVPVATAGTSDAARDCWLEDPGQPSHIVGLVARSRRHRRPCNSHAPGRSNARRRSRCGPITHRSAELSRQS